MSENDRHEGMTPRDRADGLSRATFAHDQCLACVNEIYDRAPHALLFAARPDGPLRSDRGVPEMKPGEWEAIRKLAQLGWSHFSVQFLQDQQGAEA